MEYRSETIWPSGGAARGRAAHDRARDGHGYSISSANAIQRWRLTGRGSAPPENLRRRGLAHNAHTAKRPTPHDEARCYPAFIWRL